MDNKQTEEDILYPTGFNSLDLRRSDIKLVEDNNVHDLNNAKLGNPTNIIKDELSSLLLNFATLNNKINYMSIPDAYIRTGNRR